MLVENPDAGAWGQFLVVDRFQEHGGHHVPLGPRWANAPGRSFPGGIAGCGGRRILQHHPHFPDAGSPDATDLLVGADAEVADWERIIQHRRIEADMHSQAEMSNADSADHQSRFACRWSPLARLPATGLVAGHPVPGRRSAGACVR